MSSVGRKGGRVDGGRKEEMRESLLKLRNLTAYVYIHVLLYARNPTAWPQSSSSKNYYQ